MMARCYRCRSFLCFYNAMIDAYQCSRCLWDVVTDRVRNEMGSVERYVTYIRAIDWVFRRAARSLN